MALTLEALLDPSYYLALYPDVQDAIAQGVFQNALNHYTLYGQRENRAPNPLFDPNYYLQQNPDVQNAVETGIFQSAAEHYALFGAAENRKFSLLFDRDYYLNAYPDVKNAVDTGSFKSAAEHYFLYGAAENRSPSSLFDSNYYLTLYPDVKNAVEQKVFKNALEHFELFGETEKRSPSPLFNPQDYLNRYSDVKDAVEQKIFKSAFVHFMLYGQAESRFGFNSQPTANADTFSLLGGNSLTFNVLANDSDRNGDSFSLINVTSPSHGTITSAANGAITYTPDAGFSGNESLTYTVADQYGATASATVNLTVNPRTLSNPGPTADDRFGWAVAAGGDTLVIGAPKDHWVGGTPGAAYVFDRSTGTFLRRLDNPTAANDDQFGFSTTVLSNGTIVVGAPLDDAGGADAGAVHFFNPTTGAVQTVTNPKPSEGGEFGHALAALGTSVVVGIPEEEVINPTTNTNITNAGAVVVIDSATGNITRTIENPTPGADPDDRFGWAIATSGNTLLIGAPGDDTLGKDAGAIYRYNGNTLTTFNNPNPTPFNFQVLGQTVAQIGDGFGFAIAASNNRILIGAPGQNGGKGAAYLYDSITGNLLQTFQSPNTSVGYTVTYNGLGFPLSLPGVKTFGFSVGLIGNDVLVGAPLDEAGDGAVYRFNSETGELIETLKNPTETTGFSYDFQLGSYTFPLTNIQGFGFSLAIAGNDFLVGEPGDSTGVGVAHFV
ncbi:MAG TPA: Ig-like domain-containing protein [Allocoleopsis sp.]